jgi:hypothetical protein
MTYAPKPLLDARAYLIANLDMHPGVTAHNDLDPAEVGIVGDPNHHGGYHCGWDRRRTVNGALSDYAWQESARDANHKTNAARGLDVGWFSVNLGGRQVSLYDLNRWLVAQCAAGAANTGDIREVIYTVDGRSVRRWDRLGRRSTGDSSHLSHTHISYFADSEHRDKTGLFRRFVAAMNGGAALTDPGGFLMALTGEQQDDCWRWLAMLISGAETRTDDRFKFRNALHAWQRDNTAALTAMQTTVNGLRVTVDALSKVVQSGGGNIDTAAVLARIDQRAAEEVAREQELRSKVTELEQELEKRRTADLAKARAEADALAD